MVDRKKRSVFWAVSTIVVTSGLFFPALAAILLAGVADLLHYTAPSITPYIVYIIYLLLAISYFVGIKHSLSYMQKNTYIDKPSRCILPSIIAFSLVAIFSVWTRWCESVVDMGHWDRSRSLGAYVGAAVFYLAVVLFFAKMTRKVFLEIEEKQNSEVAELGKDENVKTSIDRPKSVKVFGVLNIIFGLYAILASPFIVIMQASSLSSNCISWPMFNLASGIFLSIALVILGAGLLQFRPWARIWTVRYAIINIIFVIIIQVVNIAKVNSELALLGSGAVIITNIFIGILNLAYPVLLIIFMTKPRVVAAFKQG